MTEVVKGQQVKCQGFNLQCRRTVEAVRFVCYLDEPKRHPKKNGIGESILDCVIESRDGIKVMFDSQALMA